MSPQLISEMLQLSFIIPPVLRYFYLQFQINLFPQEFFDVNSRLGSRLLKCLSFVPNDNPLLRFAQNIYDSPDPVDIFPLPEGFDLHLAGIRDLLFIVLQDLFTNDLTDKEPFGSVSECIFREIFRS